MIFDKNADCNHEPAVFENLYSPEKLVSETIKYVYLHFV